MRGPWSKFAAFGGRGEPDNFRRTYSGGPGPSCAKLDGNPPNSDGGPGPSSFSLPGGLVSMAVILAAARAVCSDTDSVTVTDPDDVDVSNSNSIRIRNVLPLRSARGPPCDGWRPRPRRSSTTAAPADPRLRQTYLAAAAAALTLFRTPTPGQWLLSAAQCVADRRQSRSQGPVFNPIRYLMGVLRRQCSLLAIDVREDSEAEKDAAKTWFAGVMRPFEVAVELQCAAAVPAVASSPKPPVTAAARDSAKRRGVGRGGHRTGPATRRQHGRDRRRLPAPRRRRALPCPGAGRRWGPRKSPGIRGDLEKGGAERQREPRAEGGGRKAAGEPAIASLAFPTSPFRPPP